MIDEPGSEWTHGIWADFPNRFASRLAYVESRAALAAAFRSGRIASDEIEATRAAFERVWRELTVIEASESVVEIAAVLAERRELRGYDAVQLATAMTACIEPRDTLMLTWDAKLAEASAAEGISVVRTTRLD